MNPETQKLYELLESITFKLTSQTNNRPNFNKHRRNTFGYVRERFSGKTALSLYSKRFPYIFFELIKYGKRICPHPFTTIHVVQNLVCNPHKDPQNIGDQTIISLGEYTGCKLVIENQIYDAFCNPITFNGAEKMHWNTDDLVGNKYSLIFYNIKDGISL